MCIGRIRTHTHGECEGNALIFFFLRSVPYAHTQCVYVRARAFARIQARTPQRRRQSTLLGIRVLFFLFFFISSCFVMTCNVRRRDRESEHDSLALSHGSNDY